MKIKIVKILTVSVLFFTTALFANTSNAQCIQEMDYYEHTSPTVNSGDLIGVFVYQNGYYASFPSNPWDYTVTAQVYLYDSGRFVEMVDVNCSIFSSGVEFFAPRKPTGTRNVTGLLNLTVKDNSGKCGTYYFSKNFYYK